MVPPPPPTIFLVSEDYYLAEAPTAKRVASDNNGMGEGQQRKVFAFSYSGTWRPSVAAAIGPLGHGALPRTLAHRSLGLCPPPFVPSVLTPTFETAEENDNDGGGAEGEMSTPKRALGTSTTTLPLARLTLWQQYATILSACGSGRGGFGNYPLPLCSAVARIAERLLVCCHQVRHRTVAVGPSLPPATPTPKCVQDVGGEGKMTESRPLVHGPAAAEKQGEKAPQSSLATSGGFDNSAFFTLGSDECPEETREANQTFPPSRRNRGDSLPSALATMPSAPAVNNDVDGNMFGMLTSALNGGSIFSGIDDSAQPTASAAPSEGLRHRGRQFAGHQQLPPPPPLPPPIAPPAVLSNASIVSLSGNSSIHLSAMSCQEWD